MSNDKKNKSDNKTIFLLILVLMCVLFEGKVNFLARNLIFREDIF